MSENPYAPKQAPIGQAWITYGIVYFAIGIGLFYSSIAIGIGDATKWMSNLEFIYPIIPIVLCVQAFKKTNEGRVQFGRAFLLGLLTTLVGALLVAIAATLILHYLEPEALTKLLEMTYDELQKQKMSEKQLKTAMEWTTKFMTPGWMMLFTFIRGVFIGTIISLIVGAIAKKD